VIDTGLPDMDGLEVTRLIVGVAPCAKIVVVSAFCRDPSETVFCAGARGYLLKGDCGRELATAVRTVSNSGTYLGLHLKF
jgi:DNA-binding NarL/FixJ family response regulator